MLTERSVIDLRSDLSTGRLSASELMSEALDQIEALNPVLNAIVSLRDRETLIAEARAAQPGALSGIPVAIKDLTNTAGLRTTFGSPIFTDHIPEQDDRLAARLKAAGAIVIGKTNTPEFGLGSQTFNPVFGRTLNPFDTSRTCGGSSGGAAVAIASGMLPVADGSDMMGSLRNPAAWANIYGLRPTAGLIARYGGKGAMALPLSTDGAMARHPVDLELMLDLLGGSEPGWPHHVHLRTNPNGLDGTRIGWLAPAYNLPLEDGLLDNLSAALKFAEDAGAIVNEVRTLPFSREGAWKAWTGLRAVSVAAEQVADFKDPAKRDKMKSTLLYEIEQGLKQTTQEVHNLNVLRSQVLLDQDLAFEDFDVFALPSTQVWPFELETEYPTEIAGQKMDTYHRWMEVMVPASLTGLPAISLPAGFGENGLPFGLQLIGPRGADLQLIRIAEDWDRLTAASRTRPPLLRNSG